MDRKSREEFYRRYGDPQKSYSRSNSGFFEKFGRFAAKTITAVFTGLLKSVKFILSELLSLGVSILKFFLWVLKELTAPFRERFNINKDMTRKVNKAKKEGAEEYKKALFEFWCSYLFGEDGVFYTAFNYILPTLSIVFLVGIIRYGSGLEYGLSVEYNGREIGMITAEADFEEAEREVQQRIAYHDSDEPIDLSAKYSLKIINENDTIVSSAQLANEMLEASQPRHSS